MVAEPNPPIDNNTVDDDDESDLLAKFQKWDKELDAHWGDWLTESREAYDFVAGHQWATDVIAELEESGRVPVTFNRIAPTIDAVSGAEIMGRQQVIYEPRQIGASAQNEVLSKGAEWVRDECDAEHEESEALKDTLICGVGWTETRMNYDDEPDGQIVIERCDPLQTLPDPSSRKANFADRRYIRTRIQYSKDEFEELFPGESPEGSPQNSTSQPVIVDPERRYENGMDELSEDAVWVSEYQWFDTVTTYRVSVIGQSGVVDAAGLAALQEAAEAENAIVQYVPLRTKRFRKAFVAGNKILDTVEIETGDFTRQAITGKRDRNKGTWYGLVRPMIDPQRFSNKFYVQGMSILNANAKGGLMAETDAFDDQRDAEDTWADPAKITWLKPGGMAKIKEKTAPAFPPAIQALMEVAVSAIRDTTGVNQEMLGLAEGQQPGILDRQRKQSAYGILSAFFDAKKRYVKMQGRVLLQFMKRYLPEDYLVRIVGQDGSPTYQAIGSAFKDDNLKFNVIVDDAPAGPDEKASTFEMLMKLMPLLEQAQLPASVWAEFVTYSPLPTSIAQAIKTALLQAEQQKQQQGQSPEAQMGQQLQVVGAVAKIKNESASADRHSAQANLLNAKAQGEAAAASSTTAATAATPSGLTPADLLDIAKAHKLEADTVNAIFPPQAPAGPEIY